MADPAETGIPVEQVSGTIERVTFHNPENGFAVLRVVVQGRRDLVTVVANLTSVSAGEYLEATGRWTVDPEHGRQFKADQVTTSPPASAEGIQRYLAAGSLRGIGPHLAERIVKIYGDQTLRIIERTPDFLLHVSGIGPKRLKRIRESWAEQREVQRIMLFLQEHGIGTGGRATRIYRTYGQQAIARIQEDPFRLADEIRGIGFKTADQLAARLGMAPDAPQRVRAAVRFCLHTLTSEGHCASPREELVERTQELVGVATGLIEEAIDHDRATGRLVQEQIEGAPWLYLAALHRAETGLAQLVQRLIGSPGHPLPQIDVSAALSWVQQRLDLQMAAAQQDAIHQVCRSRLTIITGGPGVGKTTLIRSLLEIFAAKQRHCVLAAPTGRAAKRMAEATGREAKTLHRLLEFDPGSGDFRRSGNFPLEGHLFVLDEMSMVDLPLAYKFFRAVPRDACVVLVGDVDQLPAVGPGNVLADLIRSQVVPTIRLTEVFRQAQQSKIITAAYEVNAGRVPDLEHGEALEDFYFVEADDPEAVQRMILRLIAERIPDRFGLDPLSQIQVLTPMNRTPLGTRHLNQILQAELNPAGPRAEVERFGSLFRVGDRVLQIQNNYDREVFNGDQGMIAKIDSAEHELIVSFDGRRVVYDFNDLDELQLAYAVSIHKSQGSEYPAVVIPLHTQHFVMLQRNLLYTALTRAKQLVVLVGLRKALNLAVNRQETRQRYSALARRLMPA